MCTWCLLKSCRVFETTPEGHKPNTGPVDYPAPSAAAPKAQVGYLEHLHAMCRRNHRVPCVFAPTGHGISGLSADGDRKYLHLYIRMNLAQLGCHISKTEFHHS